MEVEKPKDPAMPLATCSTMHIRQLHAPVGPVGRAHDDDVRARLEAVHQRQQLRHNAPLHLSLQEAQHETSVPLHTVFVEAGMYRMHAAHG